MSFFEWLKNRESKNEGIMGWLNKEIELFPAKKDQIGRGRPGDPDENRWAAQERSGPFGRRTDSATSGWGKDWERTEDERFQASQKVARAKIDEFKKKELDDVVRSMRMSGKTDLQIWNILRQTPGYRDVRQSDFPKG